MHGAEGELHVKGVKMVQADVFRVTLILQVDPLSKANGWEEGQRGSGTWRRKSVSFTCG